MKHKNRIKQFKPNDRIDQLIYHFQEHEKDQADKESRKTLVRNVKPSKGQKVKVVYRWNIVFNSVTTSN